MKKILFVILLLGLLGVVGSAFAASFSLTESTATDTWLNLTLTTANTEYSQRLPQGVVAFEFQCRTSAVIKWGASGQTGTKYWTLKAGISYSTFGLATYNYSDKVLYFQSATAGVVVEIHAIIKP